MKTKIKTIAIVLLAALFIYMIFSIISYYSSTEYKEAQELVTLQEQLRIQEEAWKQSESYIVEQRAIRDEANKKVLEEEKNKFQIESKIQSIRNQLAERFGIKKKKVNIIEQANAEQPVTSIKWRTDVNGNAIPKIELNQTTVEQRAIALLDNYPAVKGTWSIWKELGETYKIDPILAISIARADSQLGNYLKSKNNIGNVGNNDRGDTVEYASKRDGIEAIFKVLNNKYLGNLQTVGELSGGGRAILGLPGCQAKGHYCYATSLSSWNANVLNTMSMIYNRTIDENYKFRF